MNVERHRLAVHELQVVNVRLSDGLELLLIERLLPGILNETFHGLFADLRGIGLLDQMNRRLPWPEAGHPGGGGIPLHSLVFSGLDGLD